MAKFKIALLSSSGGHLRELVELKDSYSKYDHFYLTNNSPDAISLLSNSRKYFLDKILHSKFNLISNIIKSLIVFLKERPNIVLNIGNRDMIPFSKIAHFFNIPIIYIESMARVNSLSRTGKEMLPVADKFIVQWPDLTKTVKNAIFKGTVSNLENSHNTYENIKNIDYFISVGVTDKFDRIIKSLDKAVELGHLPGKIIAQTGTSSYIPKNFNYVNFILDSKFQSLLKQSRTVITHAGVGTIIQARKYGCRVIVATRKHNLKEAVDDHQIELASKLNKLGLIEIWDTKNPITQITSKAFKAKNLKLNYPSLNDYLGKILEKYSKRIG